MTRIIAGFAGSLRIAVPGSGTRPTSDRVREAIFSALDARGAIVGERVLDLYAGSGALGLEAASRGASHVTLVDRVATVLRRNATRILAQVSAESAPTIEISSQPVQSFLNSAGVTGPGSVRAGSIGVRSIGVRSIRAGSAESTKVETQWGLVFIDPPYELGLVELQANLEALAPQLAEGATVVLERSSRTPAPAWPDSVALDKRKDYGDTALYWLRSTGRA